MKKAAFPVEMGERRFLLGARAKVGEGLREAPHGANWRLSTSFAIFSIAWVAGFMMPS
jgi:hypothetical protein